jgi:2-iminobutanoate/2-iminopropanoate deaminase
MTDPQIQVLKNIDAVLAAAGSSKNSVLKMNCYLSDFKRDFRAFEEVYHEHFGDHVPARINIEIPNLPGGVLIEIDFVAAVEN